MSCHLRQSCPPLADPSLKWGRGPQRILVTKIGHQQLPHFMRRHLPHHVSLFITLLLRVRYHRCQEHHPMKHTRHSPNDYTFNRPIRRIRRMKTPLLPRKHCLTSTCANLEMTPSHLVMIQSHGKRRRIELCIRSPIDWKQRIG